MGSSGLICWTIGHTEAAYLSALRGRLVTRPGELSRMPLLFTPHLDIRPLTAPHASPVGAPWSWRDWQSAMQVLSVGTRAHDTCFIMIFTSYISRLDRVKNLSSYGCLLGVMFFYRSFRVEGWI